LRLPPAAKASSNHKNLEYDGVLNMQGAVCIMLTVIVTEDEFKANNGPDIIVLIK
jgi:hypothetical protein